jgi:hypothetical protein
MSTAPVYVGVLANGVKYNIHQSSGFSNKCDLAVEVANEFIAVITIVPKRNGSIEVIPMANGRMTIKAPEKSPENETPSNPPNPQDPVDLLSGVVTIRPGTQPQL